MTRLRVGIVGARRERQGLGPFVVRELLRAGAEVPCFLATSAESLDAARAELREAHGIEPRGHLDLDALLAEPLDALAILSPAETHRGYLEAALAAGVHVLCEKPFVWGEPGLAAKAAALAAGFDAKGLTLFENCQWPRSLPAYERLFPARGKAPTSIEMWLEPASAGVQALGDAMPHVLSVAQTLVPGGGAHLEEIAFERPQRDAARQGVCCVFRTDAHSARLTANLARGERRPREAALAVDGRRARRLVSGADYRLCFAAGDRRVPLEDPLALLVADFVQELRGEGRGSRSREIAERMRLLEAIVLAFERACGALEAG